MFYEQCADYPLKLRLAYNLNGQLIDECFWEVYGGILNTACKTISPAEKSGVQPI